MAVMILSAWNPMAAMIWNLMAAVLRLKEKKILDIQDKEDKQDKEDNGL